MKVEQITLSDKYLKDIRKLAKFNRIAYKKHCMQRMIQRNIKRSEIKEILTSETSEIIEIQRPTEISPNERILVYDPTKNKAIIVVLTFVLLNEPELRIITVEYVDSEKWIKKEDGPPSIERKHNT